MLHYPRAMKPYTPAEVTRLLWWAHRQVSALRRQGLAAAVALGVGAGLRGTEMLTVRSSDVRLRGDHVIVTVRGPSARQVPVRPAYAGAVLEATSGAQGRHLFRDPVPWVQYVHYRHGRADQGNRRRATGFRSSVGLCGADTAALVGVERCWSTFTDVGEGYRVVGPAGWWGGCVRCGLGAVWMPVLGGF